jgi:hypothetical protein
MPTTYQLKPCRMCGGPKEKSPNPHTHTGWYCTKCRAQVFKKYDRNLCESKDQEHQLWNCLSCRRIKKDRQREAAMRGVATRAKNNVKWKKPFNAEKFWQRRAHGAVQLAIRRGILPSLKAGEYACADCGAIALEYDHRDYGRPLDVQPVCRSCNHNRGTAIWPSTSQYNFARIAPTKSEAA